MDRIVLVLRFRDLVDPRPGQTVIEHTKVIAECGYTWWGWWKKQVESVPEAIWARLRQEIDKAGPAPAYLLDSGQRKLYKTEILDLEFEPGRTQTPAPENGTKTPQYYAKGTDGKTPTAGFATWFKISTISEVDATEVQALAYDTVPHDDLVQVTPELMNGRRIGSISDLLLFGNVTYWVLKRAAHDAAPAARPNVQIPPAIAPTVVVTAQNHRVLHISDLHVAQGHHAFALHEGDEHNLTLATALLNALGPNNLPGIVLVTGDLTWTGSSEEFDAAFRCLDAIRSVLGLTRQHFVIIPGNHDFGWIRKDASEERDESKRVPEYYMANSEARANYQQFFRDWYETDPDKHLVIGRRFFVSGGGTLDVLGFNSQALQQTQGQFAGIGRVPEAVWHAASQAMKWTDPVKATTRRFVLTHHHLLPVVPLERPEDAGRGFGMALDAASQLASARKFDVDLVLHGHQHHPFAGYFSAIELLSDRNQPARGVHVIGGGSVAVADHDLGPIHQRTFNLLELNGPEITCHLYATTGGQAFELRRTIRTDRHGWSRPSPDSAR